MSRKLRPLLLAGVLACTASTARAQTAADEAVARLEAIDTLRLGIFRLPTATLAIGDDAASGKDASGGFGFGLALLGLEKRGAAWELARLDELRFWTHGEVSLAFTVIDLQQLMFGTDINHDACVAALYVLALGDCQYGGWFGVHAQLFHHAYASESGRWFHRWLEVGAVFSPLGDSFDVDFVRARLPITLGVSVDQVANVPLPEDESHVRLRGLASVAGVLRFADYRLELTGAVEYRPALAPFDFKNDSALDARVRFAYVWLAALLGAIRAPAQRIYFEARASAYGKPAFSERPIASHNVLELTIGFELGLREITPS